MVVRPKCSFLVVCHPTCGLLPWMPGMGQQPRGGLEGSAGAFPVPGPHRDGRRWEVPEMLAFPPRNGSAGAGRVLGGAIPATRQEPWLVFAVVGAVGARPCSHSGPVSLCPCGLTLDPRLWGLSLGSLTFFYALMLLPPNFGGCAASGRASSRPLLPANAVERASLGNSLLYKVWFQFEEEPCSLLDWA